MSGMNETIETRLLSLTPHLILTQSQDEKGGLASPLRLSKHDLFGTEIEHEGFFEKQDLIVRTLEGQFRGVQGYGIDKETFEMIFAHLRQLERRHRSKDSRIQTEVVMDVPGEDEVILGADLARNLGVLDGEEITLMTPESFVSGGDQNFKARKVRVKRVLGTQVEELDTQVVFYTKDVTLAQFRSSASLQKGVEIWLNDFRKAPRIKKQLAEFFGNSDRTSLRIETWKEKNSALFLALLLEKTMIGLFLGMAGILSGFSVVTVMILLISQKRKDIALLKTLGLSQTKTVRLFVKIGTLMGLVGIVPGLLLSLVASLYIQFNPVQILPDIYYDSTIPARVSFGFFGLIFVVSVLLCALASAVPARRTLRVEPAEVLRGQ
jgi:lipoprotein-releasing system permease protein